MKSLSAKEIVVIICTCIVVGVMVFAGGGGHKILQEQFYSREVLKMPPTTSATSGALFKGEKIRSYRWEKQEPHTKTDSVRLIRRFKEQHLPENMRNCRKWAVVTTIFKASEAVRKMASNPHWCLVVVPDLKTPSEMEYNVDCFYFSDRLQAEIFPEFADLVPKNHFGRKNLGYLLAYVMEAEQVWDFDDDNEGMVDLDQVKKDGFLAPCGDQQQSLIVNPYKHFGAAGETFCWPRGFPLDHIQDVKTMPKLCQQEVKDSEVYAYQSLANIQPDVDGIYRLTRKTPFDFLVPDPSSFVVPRNVYTPFNAQATLWNRFGLPFLYLPCSVHGRVSDIYRSYFTQYIVHNEGSNRKLVFTKPYVVQNRNVHNYLADFNAELPLYERASTLVEYLSQRPYDHDLSVAENLMSLYVDMYERGYLEQLDLILMKRWSSWIQSAQQHS